MAKKLKIGMIIDLPQGKFKVVQGPAGRGSFTFKQVGSRTTHGINIKTLQPSARKTGMTKNIDELYVKALEAAKRETKRSKEENIHRYGEKGVRKVSPVYRDNPSQKKLKLALVDGQWYTVSNVHKDPHSWKNSKFFFGIGSGFDIIRVLIQADSLEDAWTAGQEKYPKLFFTKIITGRQYDKLDGDDWEENPDNYEFIESLGKWGLRDEDIRIAKEAKEYVSNAVQAEPHSRKAILPDGRQVEYG